MNNCVKVNKIVVGQLDVNCYIVSDGRQSEAMIIDPGDEAERISDVIDAEKLVPKYIVFTHSHYDHVCAVKELKDKYGSSLVMHESEVEVYENTKKMCMAWGYDSEDFPPPDVLVIDGYEIKVGEMGFKVVHTPGHTPGGICLFGDGIIFTGDTLFSGAAGRTDLPGGDIVKLFNSLKKIASLPSDTKVLCGHGDETTIGYEIENNPFIVSA
jgi:glyoxylase-like metal-dependent hydrolase (beta-lactamase superfamily II)